MKSFFWNVRGLNGKTRKNTVIDWIKSNRPLIGGFLETHVQQSNLQQIMRRVVPGWRFEGNYSQEAQNGRIVVAWDPAISVIFYFSSDQLVLCGIFNPQTSESFSAAFVYARNTREERLSLWGKILEFAQSSTLRDSPLVVLGDFNQVLSASEIYPISSAEICAQGIQDFSDYISESAIFDLAFRGCPFTWTNKSLTNPKARKLDRALVNEAWLDRFPDSNAFFDVPGTSDHCPCLLSLSNELSPRKSRFMFFEMFSSHPDYHRLMEEAWKAPIREADPLFSLYQRLRNAKGCCWTLNRNNFSNIQARVKESLSALQDIQRHVLTDPSPELFEDEKEAYASWMFLAAAEESFLYQKSRIRWLNVGILNTGVFHKAVRANLSKNVIHFLLDELERRVYDSSAIKTMILSYYMDLLGSANQAVSPFTVEQIQDIHPYRCSADLSVQLSALPSDEEIRNIIFSLPKSKAPGPDGFSVEFFLSSWELVGSDLIAAVKDFFVNPVLSRQVNSTVIALLPKVPGAARLSEFRPISLCNTVYKIIYKLIGNRLRLITPLAVQRNQVGFISGRLLCENVLLASELVTDFNKPGEVSRGCLQIDITKAYDNVDWRYVMNILEAFGLPPVFITWVRSCVTSPHYSVAFNGELVGFFPGEKGLRQGDPISSSLFVLAMDILSKSLDKAARNSIFGIHPKCSYPLITHLCFADDMLIFFDGSSDSLVAILELLNEFYAGSGLQLNLQKTGLFLDGANHSLTRELATTFGLSQGCLPVRYLGLPLMPHRLRPQEYQPLIDRVRKKIKSWTIRNLSFAGRLQLIQSVLYGMFNFWASVFPLPKGCIDAIEQMCNAFLWSGDSESARGAKVSWVSVCTPRKVGGLGLRCLQDSNNVFSLKLIWLLFAATGSLWVAWVKHNIVADRLFWDFDFSASGSWIWRRLMDLRPLARPFLICYVQSGDSALFWHDNWTGLGPLIEITGPNGPRVTGISLSSVVSQAIREGEWALSRGCHSTIQLLRACLPIQPPSLIPHSDDYFLWRTSADVAPTQFSAARTWDALHPALTQVPWYRSIWFKSGIPKHAFHAWVTVLGRLPTRDRLLGWGMSVPANCLLCGTSNESRDHLFFTCSYSREVWNFFFTQRNFNQPYIFSEVIRWVHHSTPPGKLRIICKLVMQTVFYAIWIERNKRLHTSVARDPILITREIQVILKAKLYGMDQNVRNLTRVSPLQQNQGDRYLHLWFHNFPS